MSKDLDVAGPVGNQVGRIMGDLLGSAIGRLRARGDVHEAVHDARKDLKAFRSYLRLVRRIIGGDDYRALNEAARDAARSLSEARDSQALHDAIGQLERRQRGARARFDIAPLRRAADGLVAASANARTIRALSRQVADALGPCRARMLERHLTDDRDAYLDGLATTYRRARRALRLGLATGIAEDLHEARKAVIHWRYQMELFSGLWPRLVKAEVRELQDLREDLGQHNDLVMLQNRIEAGRDGFGGLAEAERYLDVITVLRADRVRTAGRRAALVLWDSPRARRARLAAWWAVA